MTKNLRHIMALSMMSLTFAWTPVIYGMDVKSLPDQAALTEDIFLEILKQPTMSRATERVLELGPEVSFKAICSVFGELCLVCQEWRTIIDKNFKTKDYFIEAIIAAYRSRGHEEACTQFLKGKLIYTPSADGASSIEFFFANLEKPFKGAFDLSQCEDTDKYMRMSAGFREGQILEKENRITTWFAPRFLVETVLASDKALHLKEVFETKWASEVKIGIFWTWSGHSELFFDYQLSQSIMELSSENLYKKWEAAEGVGTCWWQSEEAHQQQKKFRIVFYTETK